MTAACGLVASGSGGGAEPLLALTIDSPDSPEAVLPLKVAGWGADLSATEGSGVDLIEVLDGGCNGASLGSAAYGISRPDVAEEQGTQFARSGWELVVEALSAGEHRLGVRLRSAVGAASACETVSVTILPLPLVTIEDPAAAGSLLLPFRIGGWGVDLGALSGPGVDRVEILDGGCAGELLGVAEYGIIRGDVADRYGHQFGESGWQMIIDELSGGEHLLAVQLYSSAGDESVCKTVTVTVL